MMASELKADIAHSLVVPSDTIQQLQKSEDLLGASTATDIDQVQQLISHGADVNFRDKVGFSLLACL